MVSSVRARRWGGVALLLALTLFLEQQLFLAVLFGGGLLLMAARAVSRPRSARRRRRLRRGSGTRTTRCRTHPGRDRPEWTVPGRATGWRKRTRSDWAARGGGSPFAALAGHDFTWARRYARTPWKTGSRARRRRGRRSGHDRRRLPFRNRWLACRYRAQLNDRLRWRPDGGHRNARGGGGRGRRGSRHARRRRRGGFRGPSHGPGGDRLQSRDGRRGRCGQCRSCGRRGLRRCLWRRFGGRRFGGRGRGNARRARLRFDGRLSARLEQNGAHQIGDLVRHDAQLVFRLEDASQSFVEKRREFF